MRYFNNIETITYDEIYSVKNIFSRVILDSISKDVIGYIDLNNYIDPRIYIISNRLYGTTQYWWILALLNNKYDIIYDMPLPMEILEAASVGSESEELTPTEIVDRYDALLAQNDDSRYFKVIKPIYMNSVLIEIVKQIRGY